MSLDLDLQLQHLIEQAPQDGITPDIMAEVIGPVLKALAIQLPRSHYFVVESLSKGLVVTTLRNRLEPDLTKAVIYAFASVEDADHFKNTGDHDLRAKSIPLMNILFQLFYIPQIESVVFMENHDPNRGREVQKSDLRSAIEKTLKHWQARRVPPNLA